MSKASLDRFHQIHKPAVLMVGLPAYVAALDDLMFATRHKSRVSLVAAALELYAQAHGSTLPPRLEKIVSVDGEG